MRVRVSSGYLGYGCRGGTHVFAVDEDVHGVVVAPLHPDAVPNLKAQIWV